MLIEIRKIAKRNGYVISNLFVNGEYFCDTLENAKHTIPAGDYSIAMQYNEPTKEMLPFVQELEDVHFCNGNTARDNSHIIVGLNKEVSRIVNSTKYLSQLLKLIERENEIKLVVIR